MTEATPTAMLNKPPARRALPEGEFRAVVYRVDSFYFATDVAQVQEIIRPTRLARAGTLPEYVEGFIKRRGRIVPIVDLRKRLGLPMATATPETCAVIVRLPIGPVGFLVDAAIELRRLRPEAFEAPSAVVARIDQVYVQAVAHSGDDVLVMLDLQLLLTHRELTELAEIDHA